MDKEEVKTLEKIVGLKGRCLSSEICKSCPFKTKCLPSFITKKAKLSQKERHNLALDTLINVSVLDDSDMEHIDELFS